jgi:hypothetical protein
MERKQIGVVGVDSAQLVICDPLYIDTEWENEEYDSDDTKAKFNFSYKACCEKTLSPDSAGQLFYRLGHPGVGVVSSTGWGDGLYPVYATYNKQGRIMKIEIDFEDSETTKYVEEMLMANG